MLTQFARSGQGHKGSKDEAWTVSSQWNRENGKSKGKWSASEAEAVPSQGNLEKGQGKGKWSRSDAEAASSKGNLEKGKGKERRASKERVSSGAAKDARAGGIGRSLAFAETICAITGQDLSSAPDWRRGPFSSSNAPRPPGPGDCSSSRPGVPQRGESRRGKRRGRSGSRGSIREPSKDGRHPSIQTSQPFGRPTATSGRPAASGVLLESPPAVTNMRALPPLQIPVHLARVYTIMAALYSVPSIAWLATREWYAAMGGEDVEVWTQCKAEAVFVVDCVTSVFRYAASLNVSPAGEMVDTVLDAVELSLARLSSVVPPGDLSVGLEWTLRVLASASGLIGRDVTEGLIIPWRKRILDGSGVMAYPPVGEFLVETVRGVREIAPVWCRSTRLKTGILVENIDDGVPPEHLFLRSERAVGDVPARFPAEFPSPFEREDPLEGGGWKFVKVWSGHSRETAGSDQSGELLQKMRDPGTGPPSLEELLHHDGPIDFDRVRNWAAAGKVRILRNYWFWAILERRWTVVCKSGGFLPEGSEAATAEVCLYRRIPVTELSGNAGEETKVASLVSGCTDIRQTLAKNLLLMGKGASKGWGKDSRQAASQAAESFEVAPAQESEQVLPEIAVAMGEVGSERIHEGKWSRPDHLAKPPQGPFGAQPGADFPFRNAGSPSTSGLVGSRMLGLGPEVARRLSGHGRFSPLGRAGGTTGSAPLL